MRILAFDTTMNACAVALWADGETEAVHVAAMTHGQAEALLPAIEQVLAEANATYAQLDCIAVTTGPGSFTGVRVGLATARGLSLAANCPAIGIGTPNVLAATARRLRGCAGVTAVIDARRAEVYMQTFDAEGAATGEPVCVLPADITPEGVLAGDAVDKIVSVSGGPDETVELSYADPSDLAALAAQQAAQQASVQADTHPDGAPPPSPVYVRPPDAAVPRNGGRLRP